jgi:hypothetical protein
MEVVMDCLAFAYRNLSKKNLNPHYPDKDIERKSTADWTGWLFYVNPLAPEFSFKF